MSDKHENLLCVEIKIAVLCNSCNNAIPINGFVSKVKCPKCQDITQLSDRLRWSELWNYHNPRIDIFSATLNHKPGKGDYGAWNPVKLNTKRIWPVCPSCEHQFTKDIVLNTVESKDFLTCENCNNRLSIQKPPLFLKKYSFLRFTIGSNSDIDGEKQEPLLKESGTKPIVMACMACGGTLTIDGTKRLVECKFCQSSNYLPDDLWLSMHPAPKREAWYIIFDTTDIKKN